jgi:uncharacterized protein YfaS (alpha-2-macroglobulin family)
LGGFQLSNGEWHTWQGGTVADDWSTSYAGHFMIEAEKKVFANQFQNQMDFVSTKEAKQWRFMPSYGMIWHNRIAYTH